MSTVEVTIPDALAEEARRAGLLSAEEMGTTAPQALDEGCRTVS